MVLWLKYIKGDVHKFLVLNFKINAIKKEFALLSTDISTITKGESIIVCTY